MASTAYRGYFITEVIDPDGVSTFQVFDSTGQRVHVAATLDAAKEWVDDQDEEPAPPSDKSLRPRG